MTRLFRRIGLEALLWAAPLGAALALLALFVAAPLLSAGPGVLSPGDPRVWTVMWSALGLVAAGCALGFVATAAWLAGAWRRTHRLTGLEWFRTVVNLLCVAAFLWLWLG